MVEIKAMNIFLLEPKYGAWRQDGGRLGDVTEAGRPVLQGLEVILKILRFGGNFCGDHGASAPPPSANCVSYIYLPSILGKLHTAKIFKRLIIDQIKVT